MGSRLLVGSPQIKQINNTNNGGAIQTGVIWQPYPHIGVILLKSWRFQSELPFKLVL